VPVDFVILKIEEDAQTPIILRRPFLVSTRCRIDVKNGQLSFDTDDDYVEFNLFKASKFPSISKDCHRINVINSLIQKIVTNRDSISAVYVK